MLRACAHNVLRAGFARLQCVAFVPNGFRRLTRLTTLLCVGRFAANMRMFNPTKKMPQKNWSALEKAGWNPHSVELLGMVDKETLSNLTRAFADEGGGFGRSLSSESREEPDTANNNKKGGRRYVVHCQTGDSHQSLCLPAVQPRMFTRRGSRVTSCEQVTASQSRACGLMNPKRRTPRRKPPESC